MSQKIIPKADDELLKLIFILTKICLDTDINTLYVFINYCGRYLTDKEFSNILRKTLKFIKQKECKGQSCEDWLMLSLYNMHIIS